MPVSVRTIYSYISKGVFDISNIDLRRMVQRKAGRRKSGPVLHVDKQCHIKRTYADFQAYLEKHPEFNVCEMDTVEGKRGGKVILTIFFRDSDLQLMILRDSKTAAEITDAYHSIRKKLGDDFTDVFKIILTDRGTEFTDPGSIEMDPETGEYDCNLFYCDPQQTDQKSRCERNHEYIRYILPKGSSFDELTQEDINLVMNNVNSMPRGKLNAKSPYQVFVSLYGKEIAAKLGLKYVPLEQICLTPDLLHR
jgi:IS30 family transposase